MNKLGPKLRKIRLSRKITQREAARLAAIDTSTLCSIEIGRAQPSMASLHRLAAVYDCEVVIRCRRAA